MTRILIERSKLTFHNFDKQSHSQRSNKCSLAQSLKFGTKRRRLKKERLSRLKQNGKVIPTENIVAALEAVIEPGNKVVLEGNNQKQADFLARSLCELNPDKVHDLHMIIPSMSLPGTFGRFEKASPES